MVRVAFSAPGIGITAAACADLPTTGATEDPVPPAPSAPEPTDSPSDPPSAPSQPGPPSVIEIGPSPVVTLNPSLADTLFVTVWDENGNVLDLGSSPDWTTEAGSRVSVVDGVVVAGDELGLARVWAQVAGIRDSVLVWIQPPEEASSDFDITLYVQSDVPEWWRDALVRAAEGWKQVIRAPLPPVDVSTITHVCEYPEPPPADYYEGTERGVRILVSWRSLGATLPSGQMVRALGGQCGNRGLPSPTSVYGIVVINADLGDEIPNDIDIIAHHEVGHALGLFGGVQRVAVPWFDPSTEVYSGPLALYGFRLDGGAPFDSVRTSGGHWPYPGVMGTTLAPVIRHYSVGGLMEMGYPAAWYGAGPL